jgi:hypothetical protein
VVEPQAGPIQKLLQSSLAMMLFTAAARLDVAVRDLSQLERLADDKGLRSEGAIARKTRLRAADTRAEPEAALAGLPSGGARYALMTVGCLVVREAIDKASAP